VDLPFIPHSNWSRKNEWHPDWNSLRICEYAGNEMTTVPSQ
jgi:hypothetical protein